MFASLGTFISIPPKIELALMTASLVILAFCKSKATLANTTSILAPLNSYNYKY
jgi:hypothetical protein